MVLTMSDLSSIMVRYRGDLYEVIYDSTGDIVEFIVYTGDSTVGSPVSPNADLELLDLIESKIQKELAE